MTVASARRLAAALLPWRAAAASTLLLWLLHGLFWGGLLVALWQLNRFGGLEHWLRSPWPILHHVWLPLLAVVLYVLGWLGAKLWLALSSNPPGNTCREVDAAWNEAVRMLEQDYPRIQDMPLFLVLGSLTADLRAVLEAAGAAQVASRLAAPLHVFAQEEGIFVVCAHEKVAGPLSSPLQHLCRLLCRDRPGRRTLQGVVLSVPFAALHSDVEMCLAIARCQDDLQVIRHTTGLECPVYVAITGLDNLPENLAQGWFQRFPLMPDCEPEEMAESQEQGVDQLCLDRIPHQVRQQVRFDVSPAVQGTLPEALSANIRLHEWVASAQHWRKRLYRLLKEATWNKHHEPGLLAGSYFLPTAAVARQAPVVEALWSDLLAHRQAVTWTPETWVTRALERQITRAGYAAIAAGWLSFLAMAGWVFLCR